MSYYCPLCQKSDWHTITGLENHIWQSHKESMCCMSHWVGGHRSKGANPKVEDCHGNLDMATCATKHAYKMAGLPWLKHGNIENFSSARGGAGNSSRNGILRDGQTPIKHG